MSSSAWETPPWWPTPVPGKISGVCALGQAGLLHSGCQRARPKAGAGAGVGRKWVEHSLEERQRPTPIPQGKESHGQWVEMTGKLGRERGEEKDAQDGRSLQLVVL
ncbi:hypothetical protein DFH06DRAFT_1152569 [Mycena polygramma]|nr:hypothetical protein DFH06DRAFT_1152569 [Mycena polygramma]